MNLRTSRGRKPPGSGQPVPGTKAASRQSTSKDSPTASTPSQATSSARSAAASMPISTQSGTVMIVVPPSRATVTAGGAGLDAPLDAVGDGHDRRAAVPADLHAGARSLPAADADLNQVLRRHVR